MSRLSSRQGEFSLIIVSLSTIFLDQSIIVADLYDLFLVKHKMQIGRNRRQGQRQMFWKAKTVKTKQRIPPTDHTKSMTL
jgi:hypothetical protein